MELVMRMRCPNDIERHPRAADILRLRAPTILYSYLYSLLVQRLGHMLASSVSSTTVFSRLTPSLHHSPARMQMSPVNDGN